MHHDGMLPWNDDQWAMLEKLGQDTARKIRVAASFLPLEGPLPPGQHYVPRLTMTSAAQPLPLGPGAAPERLEVNEDQTAPLLTIACSIYLRAGEAQDPELTSAKQMVTRAASVLARLEDELIFHGAEYKQGSSRWERLRGGALLTGPDIFTVRGNQAPQQYGGVFNPVGRALRQELPVDDVGRAGGSPAARATIRAGGWIPPSALPLGPAHPEDLVEGIAEAIQTLETDGYFGPFACVLGRILYVAALHPTTYMVLPSDRIVPLLGGGTLVSSVTIDPARGFVAALGGGAIDLVIGSDLGLSYIGRTEEPRYVLSLSESFRLRIKDTTGGGPVQPIVLR